MRNHYQSIIDILKAIKGFDHEYLTNSFLKGACCLISERVEKFQCLFDAKSQRWKHGLAGRNRARVLLKAHRAIAEIEQGLR